MATGPTVSSIQWIPEDDLLLKNAVEAGASLEALAKGAVSFSCKYTLRELRERWHSLLYDPDISAQASAHIFELEISGYNPAQKYVLGNKDVSCKRKSESIRRKYYAMRKKFRNEFFSNSDLGFFGPNQVMHDDNNNNNNNNNDHMGQSCMIGDSISDQLGLQEEDLDILRHAFPGTITDIAVASADVSQTVRPNSFEENRQNGLIRGYGFDENVTEGGNNILETMVFASDQPHLRHWRTMQDTSVHVSMTLQDTGRVGEDMTIPNDVEGKENSSTTVYTGEFADPDSLLNLLNEDEILLVDVDENHAADNKFAFNETDSILQENDSAKAEYENVIVSEANKPDVVETDLPFTNTNVASNSISNVDHTELRDSKICCTLNTEDTEIPCNDDIFLLIHPSTSFGSSATQQNISMNSSAAASENDKEQAVTLPIKAKDSTKASAWRQKMGGHSLPELHSPPVGCGAKPEIHDSNKSIGDSSKGRSLYAVPKACSNGLAEKGVGVDVKVGDNTVTVTEVIKSAEAGSTRTQLPESMVDDSVSYQEDSLIDDDVPYFSDIEAMILEMDFDSHDQDSRIITQVPNYQYDDTKRTIIRLEQSSRSCLQRAMTTQGALAILYGRHLKHYIRKAEVLIGRSTDDVDVDIDLSKEGRANKISRRQAIIKMEADGSFVLKNLGKSSVSVNGTTVATGQLLNLSSSCLIEIKGMSFVFEINQGYVWKHLGIFCPENKGKMGKSDWSGEDES